MKKNIILTFSFLAITGLAFAASAFTRAADANQAAESCCCKGSDSCPMKHGHSEANTASCDMDHCCCKDGNSCPMKKESANSSHSGEHGAAKGCCPCCDARNKA